MVVEVALDGVPTTRPQRVLLLLGLPPEALVELGAAAVGDVGDAPGDAEALLGPGRAGGPPYVVDVADAVPAVGVVVATAERRVGADR